MSTATEIPTKQHLLARHYLRQLHNANHKYTIAGLLDRVLTADGLSDPHWTEA
jgi:hypothetical protein